MNTASTPYRYEQRHYPNNNSWYRELIFRDNTVVGEIREPVESTAAKKIYNVCKYEPLEVFDGVVHIAQVVQSFNRVIDAKEFVNNGGIE